MDSSTTSLTHDTAEIVLPIASIILISLFIIVFIYFSRFDLDPTQGTIPCGPGLCANNIYSGEKVCPASSSETVQYNPEFQTCNPPTGCNQTSQAPCLYYDASLGTICPGETNYGQGICPEGTSSEDCRCTSRIYCPDFATVYFRQENVVTPGIGEACTNFTSLVQETTWLDAANLPRNDLPISPASVLAPSEVFCGVRSTELSNIWPNNTCLRGSLILNETDQLYYCANVPLSVNCSTGQIPVRQSDGSYMCQADSAAAQFNN